MLNNLGRGPSGSYPGSEHEPVVLLIESGPASFASVSASNVRLRAALPETAASACSISAISQGQVVAASDRSGLSPDCPPLGFAGLPVSWHIGLCRGSSRGVVERSYR